MAIPNRWNLLNLRESPFFQDWLNPEPEARYPIAPLLVGREQEAERILERIGSRPHSRHAIYGPPGIGKTTLVQAVKSEAAKHGYLAVSAIASAAHADSTETMYQRILSYLYDAIISNELQIPVGNRGMMEDVRQVLHSFRTRTGGASVGIPGVFSVGGSTGMTYQNASDAQAVNLPRLLRKVSELIVEELGCPGVLIHLNNLENLTDTDQNRAGAIFRDMRDSGLMYEGLHYLIVGTGEAIATITRPAQLSSVISDHPLEALTPAQVDEMLRRRYEFLTLDERKPYHRPVEPSAVHRLYEIYDGDLRGTLSALDDAASELLGFGEDPTAPMRLSDMQPVLQVRYTKQMRAKLGAPLSGYLEALRGMDPSVPLTRPQCSDLWKLTPTATGSVVSQLEQDGFLFGSGTAAPTGPGRPPQEYRFTGRTKLIFAKSPSD